MPNGQLENHYGSRVLQAGKNPGKQDLDLQKYQLLNPWKIQNQELKLYILMNQ